MPVAHLCVECGCDLTSVSGAWNADYELRVVACPDCGRGVVRRTPPLVRAWHVIQRLDWALLALLVNLAGLVTLLAIMIGLCERAAHDMISMS
jgi:hypothetical protein